MNYLEQLQIKPNVTKMQRVVVVIQGEKKNINQKTEPDAQRMDKKSIEENAVEGLLDIGEQIYQSQQLEGILPLAADLDFDKAKEPIKKRPIIIDSTDKGYDRQVLLKKILESKKPIFVTHEIDKGDAQDITQQPSSQQQQTQSAPVVKPKRAKKVGTKKLKIIEEDEEEKDGEKEDGEEKDGEKEDKEKEVDEAVAFAADEDIAVAENVASDDEGIIKIKVPKERKRKTKKNEKGVAVLGPEVAIDWGETLLTNRLPRRKPNINIKVGNYVMNNRETFVNFINSLFEPYKRELEENQGAMSCDTIGKTSIDFSLLTHQQIVRDYMNLYTPYRGLLLYHGLGSGKTCTSIAIAEGMKNTKRVIILTPASLRANYMGELKKCGDLIYKKNQYWEWISTEQYPESLIPMSALLNLPQEYIQKNKGAFFINVTKKSNYDSLSDLNKRMLETQLNEMIEQKYLFINYNGLRVEKLAELTKDYTINIFDNSVVIIDEAHNLISRIVNKIKKEKPIAETKRGEKAHLPLNMSTKIYEFLLSAKNSRIVLLTGTPIINYPNEFGILFNILRGYIKTWKIPLVIKSSNKIDRTYLQKLLMGEKSLDYLEYSPTSKILTVTRNPFGFKNKIREESEGVYNYKGVYNNEKNKSGEIELLDENFASDDAFERKIISTLNKNGIDITAAGIEIRYKKALPDNFDAFVNTYIDGHTRKLKNTDALGRRIIGLSSYFRSAQEELLPRFNKQLGVDYHIVRINMSDSQFKEYETIRQKERKTEKTKGKPSTIINEYGEEESSSTYRIFSRLLCNFYIPSRPLPDIIKKKKDINYDENDDLTEEHVGEMEGDELLKNFGGNVYDQQLQQKIDEMTENYNEYFTPDALQTYSPKFLHILENITEPSHQGLHLVYSQFRTAEGVGLFSVVLNTNGFTQFKIKKNMAGTWVIDIREIDKGKPTYGLYTGRESSEEKEIIRKIYNGEWDDIPDSISTELRKSHTNNNMGEVMKIFIITSSGSEGINLRNTRYVHLMDPYWHPVRSEQVIGRARRICSHKDLPEELRTVEVFVYLMQFTKEQLLSDSSIELKSKDLSRSEPQVPLTTDQYLFEISEIKYNLTKQLTDIIKHSAFDCYIYSEGKCLNFVDPTIDKFSYVPDYTEQQSDSFVKSNKKLVEWTGKVVSINNVDYVYRRMSAQVFNLYDKKSYEYALINPEVIPVQVGTYEINDKGEKVLKLI